MPPAPSAAARHVLVVAPHPDDEVLGCGGTLRLHARKGDRITAVFLTSGELGLKHLPRERAWAVREEEARRAAAILGIGKLEFLRAPDWGLADSPERAVAPLARVLSGDPPDLVYAPHPADGHPDHRASLPLLRAALTSSRIAPAPEIRGFEVWTPMTDVHFVEDVSAVFAVKLSALRAHASQLEEFDYLRAIEGLNAYRGELCGRCRYAEVFEALGP